MTRQPAGREAQEGSLEMKAAAVAPTQQSTKKKWGKDALVLSEGGGVVTAHLAACSAMVRMAAMTTMTRR